VILSKSSDISDLLGAYEQKSFSRRSTTDYSLSGKELEELLKTGETNYQTEFPQEKRPKHEAGSFVWKDSTLVKAIENGDWVIIENCNLCNPSILDRLNSLLEEDNQTLAINESGMVDGELRVVTAHPEFRVFFIINESTLEFSNISAPLRNRCVELYMRAEEDKYHTSYVGVANDLGLSGSKFALFLEKETQSQ